LSFVFPQSFLSSLVCFLPSFFLSVFPCSCRPQTSIAQCCRVVLCAGS
jgi:hypothetical protein